MTVEHITENEIQQYALDKLSREASTLKHLETCEDCKARIASYQILFSAICTLPIPVNDYDLSSLVISRIKHEKRSFPWAYLFVYLLASAAIVFIGMTFYSFKVYFLQVFAEFSGMSIYLLATTVFFLLLFQVIDSYKKYQRRIEALNIE